MIYYLYILLYLFAFHVNAIDTIRIRGPQSKFDASHSYFEGLIRLAYEKNGKAVNIVYSPNMVQGRALKELQAGRLIDVDWAGADEERSSALSVVDVPLIKGLLGFRVFLTHKDNLDKLTKIATLDDLKEIILCNGRDWPDTKIMQAAGLNLLLNSVYESMFFQTHHKRCDAFPRGINEALIEFKIRQGSMPNLDLYNDLILYYPLPMYFFTAPKNTDLATMLKKGLEAAIDDGSFDDYIESHPTTKHLFPLKNWSKVRYIKLKNPFLLNIDTTNTRYWLTPETVMRIK